MAYLNLQELEAYMNQPEMLQRTEQYLTRQMKQFLKKQDRVLICFPGPNDRQLGDMLERAVLACDAQPLRVGPDYRWKTLLKIAFSSRAAVIFAPPNVVLGLMKLAKATGTPLYIRHVMTAGYPCLDWMIEGIRRGLDCQTWGCFIPGGGAVVAGFSCGRSSGVHLREELFEMKILNDSGEPASLHENGELALLLKQIPGDVYRTGEYGRILPEQCPCGDQEACITDFSITKNLDPALTQIYEQLHAWTSILDCRVLKGKYGLELEIVKFPGEKLPKLPSCAKLILRAWNPDVDEPFCVLSNLKNTDLSWESY